MKPVYPKRNQSWIFIGRIDAEAEAPILWSPDTKSQLIGKDPDAGKDWRQGEKGTTEDEMFGWHHQVNGHEFEQALGDGEGQGGLACCSPWGRKESDTTERLNWNDVSLIYLISEYEHSAPWKFGLFFSSPKEIIKFGHNEMENTESSRSHPWISHFTPPTHFKQSSFLKTYGWAHFLLSTTCECKGSISQNQLCVTLIQSVTGKS